jgi:hypothetical protein
MCQVLYINNVATKACVDDSNITISAASKQHIVYIVDADSARMWITEIYVVATEKNTIIQVVCHTMSCEVKQSYSIASAITRSKRVIKKTSTNC